MSQWGDLRTHQFLHLASFSAWRYRLRAASPPTRPSEFVHVPGRLQSEQENFPAIRGRTACGHLLAANRSCRDIPGVLRVQYGGLDLYTAPLHSIFTRSASRAFRIPRGRRSSGLDQRSRAAAAASAAEARSGRHLPNAAPIPSGPRCTPRSCTAALAGASRRGCRPIGAFFVVDAHPLATARHHAFIVELNAVVIRAHVLPRSCRTVTSVSRP